MISYLFKKSYYNFHILLIQYTQYNIYHIIISTNMDKEWILSFSHHHHISWGETYYLFHKIIPAKREISYLFGIIISAKREIENYLIFLLSYRPKGIEKDILSFCASSYQPNSDQIYERGGGKTELNYKKTWSWRSREIFHVFLFFFHKNCF